MSRSLFFALIASVLTVAAQLDAQGSAPARCGVGPPAGEKGYAPLPRGDVFCPLMADPKATRSFASVLQHRAGNAGFSELDLDIASVGIADAFGLGRWNSGSPGDGFQIALSGGVFAQFDLGTSSFDLLNADYVVGVPITFRRGWFSTRFRVYHQSSHLGDEYLLREPPDRQDRENLSFESVEWLLSADAGVLRLYGGGEFLFMRTPDDLSQYVAHGGVELRPTPRIIPLGSLGGFRFVAASDVKASGEHDWKPAISTRAGLEYDRAGGTDVSSRRWGIFAEFYTGPSPYGQFFREKVRLVGFGIHFGGF